MFYTLQLKINRFDVIFNVLAISNVLQGKPLSVGTQAVALVIHGRVADVVLDDDMEQLGLCVKLASAAKSILERQILVTNKDEELGKMLKMTEALNQMVGELQTNQFSDVFSRQEESGHVDGRF